MFNKRKYRNHCIRKIDYLFAKTLYKRKYICESNNFSLKISSISILILTCSFITFISTFEIINHNSSIGEVSPISITDSMIDNNVLSEFEFHELLVPGYCPLGNFDLNKDITFNFNPTGRGTFKKGFEEHLITTKKLFFKDDQYNIYFSIFFSNEIRGFSNRPLIRNKENYMIIEENNYNPNEPYMNDEYVYANCIVDDDFISCFTGDYYGVYFTIPSYLFLDNYGIFKYVHIIWYESNTISLFSQRNPSQWSGYYDESEGVDVPPINCYTCCTLMYDIKGDIVTIRELDYADFIEYV